MKTLKSLLFVAFTGVVATGFSQKIVKVEGDFSALKGQEVLNLEYDYSDMGVGKFKTEEEYVKTKVAEYNKDEPGRGDKWAEAWVNNRERVFQPKFEELFNKYSKINSTPSNSNARYTLVIKTTFTEPGFNVGVQSKPSAVSFEYILKDATTDGIVAKYVQNKVPGAQAMGMDFDTSTRISESYAKAGKMLGAFIAKSNKK